MSPRRGMIGVNILLILLIFYLIILYFGSSNTEINIKSKERELDIFKSRELGEISEISQQRKTSAQEFQELKTHLFPPSEKSYNLSDIEKIYMPNYNFKAEHEMPKFIHQKLLNGMKGGFFIEAGALDGEYLSNTLNLELEHQWKGVLVESNPIQFAMLLQKNRKAIMTDVCLGNLPYPETVQMSNNGAGSSRIISKDEINLNVFVTRCFPIGDIFLLLNITRVDYFSLDIEGQEMGVLKNFPWDDVELKVLSIEVNKINKKELKILMESKGFIFVRAWHGYFTDDHIYAHNSIYN